MSIAGAVSNQETTTGKTPRWRQLLDNAAFSLYVTPSRVKAIGLPATLAESGLAKIVGCHHRRPGKPLTIRFDAEDARTYFGAASTEQLAEWMAGVPAVLSVTVVDGLAVVEVLP